VLRQMRHRSLCPRLGCLDLTFGLKKYKGRYEDDRRFVLVTDGVILEHNPGVAGEWAVTIRQCGLEIAEQLVASWKPIRL
jgi:hypothetical protein